MKQILAEQGLMISREELYDDVQDTMDYNLTAYLKSIILQPGLKIANGDEFLVTPYGLNLQVNIGSVVFPDYTLFVPGPTTTSAVLDMSGMNDGGVALSSKFNVWVIPEYKDSHYVHRVRSKDLTATIRRRTIKIVVTPQSVSPGSNSYLIAMGSFEADGSISIIQNAINNILKLIPTYKAESWNSSVSILPVVTGVTAVYGKSNSNRALSFRDKDINRESLPNNVRPHYYADVSWPSPGLPELEAMGGLAYYSIKATPLVSGAEIEHKSRVQHLVFTMDDVNKSAAIRAGAKVNLDWGVAYRIRVYRVTNQLNLEMSTASAPITVNSDIQPSPAGGLLIQHTYSSSDMLLLSHTMDSTGGRYQKAYACEYDGAEPTHLNQNKYLFYTGPVQDIIYMISDKTKTHVKVRVDVFNSDHVILLSGTRIIDIDPIITEWEDIISVPMPESDTGWPRQTGEDFAATFSAASSGAPGDVALMMVDLDNIIRSDCMALMAPGIGVTIAGTTSVDLDGDRVIRQVDSGTSGLYGVFGQDASLNVDFTATISHTGTIAFPDEQTVYTFSRPNPFVISRMFMRGIPSATIIAGEELLVTVAGTAYSHELVVEDDGQGSVVLNDISKVINADEEVDVVLSLNGSTEEFNASGLVLLIYVREVK